MWNFVTFTSTSYLILQLAKNFNPLKTQKMGGIKVGFWCTDVLFPDKTNYLFPAPPSVRLHLPLQVQGNASNF